MSTTRETSETVRASSSDTETLTYDVFVNEPPPQDGVLPNGEPKRFSPTASTLIYGSEDAVLTDPGMTTDQARALGDWVASKGRNLTDIFITHGHGDHWFAAGLLAERFGARIVASAGTIAQMQANAATRPLLWDKVYTGIPRSPVTAVTVPDNRFTLEGHDLVIVEVGSTDSDDTTVLHVPDLGLVVAGDVIYNGVHMYLAQQRARRRLRAMARGDRQGRGARSLGTSSPATRTRSSTTTPSGRSPRPGSTSTTPKSSCGPRPPRSTSSTPRSSATRTISGGRSCGWAPACSTACANTPSRTSARSSSPPGSEPLNEYLRSKGTTMSTVHYNQTPLRRPSGSSRGSPTSDRAARSSSARAPTAT